MEKKGKFLIIDDNEDVLFALNAMLNKYVKQVKVITKPENILRFMKSFEPDVILLDMNFDKDASSGKEGYFWLKEILKHDPQAIVLLMTAYADTSKAVQAIKQGATDFVSKPWENDKLLATLFSALRIKETQNKVADLETRIHSISSQNSMDIIGNSDKMLQIFEIIGKLADTEANILVLGENGTGKDLIARAIHNNSPRSEKIFLTIDLGSISENLFESELFGYEKGAFTDAKKEKQGRIELASGGTLFLDEIANLSPLMQAKLLTTIEKKHISRLGSLSAIPIDVRFIAATNANLSRAVQRGDFRQDLLYRINTIEIYLPPLRERGNDVILLAEHFLKKFNMKYKKEVATISAETQKKLLNYAWPGNVRELQNMIERAVILSSKRTLHIDDFQILNNKCLGSQHSTEILNLEELEYQAIEKALLVSNGNINSAAKLLGISRFALYRKLNKNEKTEN